MSQDRSLSNVYSLNFTRAHLHISAQEQQNRRKSQKKQKNNIIKHLEEKIDGFEKRLSKLDQNHKQL